jgi:hypothetical protein
VSNNYCTDVQWELVLLVVWFLLLVICRLCNRVLEATFSWLLSSVRGNTSVSVCCGSEGTVEEVYPNIRICRVKYQSPPTASRYQAKVSKTDDEAWKDYFANPIQWWDNRGSKCNPKAPDFKHRISKSTLWIDGWHTPKWVKDWFELPFSVQ